jgi:protein ImuA
VPTTKNDIIRRLQQDILELQGFEKPASADAVDFGLGPINTSFPYQTFPTAAVHEFITESQETSAASAGFIAGLAGHLMQKGGACIWISANRLLNPSALIQFGIQPEQIIFIDVRNQKQVLWAIEEALTSEGLAAVIGEVREVDFTASRRLQLAVEKSRVTGFILRDRPRDLNANACVARWRIRPLASISVDDLPGVGFTRWLVELLRVKNGHPGRWEMEWKGGRFQPVLPENTTTLHEHRRKIV